jgi:ABC-2 type transport system ATP-binding protein
MTGTLLHRLRERARIGHRAARMVVVRSGRVRRGCVDAREIAQFGCLARSWEVCLAAYVRVEVWPLGRFTSSWRVPSLSGDNQGRRVRMIELTNVTKRYGDKVAVDDLSFTVHPGVVTGFLGPNGAGKSTTMRMIAGLDEPTEGRVRVNGQARAVHTGRSAYNHLLALAQTNGIPRSRVDEVVDLVGLRSVARGRADGFSLGMGQRLGIASALLGSPDTLVMDEPVNGLDPEGIQWIRALLRAHAAEGHTVFVSSHLMSEMALTADRLIVVGRGRLIADTSVDVFIAEASTDLVTVRTPDAPLLRELLLGPDVSVTSSEAGALDVRGVEAQQIGDLAFEHKIRLHELTPQRASLEEAFMKLTADAVEYQASTGEQRSNTADRELAGIEGAHR